MRTGVLSLPAGVSPNECDGLVGNENRTHHNAGKLKVMGFELVPKPIDNVPTPDADNSELLSSSLPEAALKPPRVRLPV